jgi:hypothetical protein
MFVLPQKIHYPKKMQMPQVRFLAALVSAYQDDDGDVYDTSPVRDTDLDAGLRASMDSFHTEQSESSVPGPVKSPSKRAKLKMDLRDSTTVLTRTDRLNCLLQGFPDLPCHVRARYETRTGVMRRNLKTEEERELGKLLHTWCPICQETHYKERQLKTKCCTSSVHEKCILPWIDLGHDTCPVCRSKQMY